MTPKKLVVCNKCGWAHFPITEQEAIEQAKSFKAYFDSLSSEEKASYYKRETYSVEESVNQQKHCFHCGNDHKDFHEETPEDKIPMGVTIQGIIEG